MASPAVDYFASLTFPQRLMELLDDSSHDHVASWTNDGRSFLILDKSLFVDDVLPKFSKYKKSKFLSFTRKLNRWGFYRVHVRSHSNCEAYRHPLFQKGKYQLLRKMSCSPSGKKIPTRKSILEKVLVGGSSEFDSNLGVDKQPNNGESGTLQQPPPLRKVPTRAQEESTDPRWSVLLRGASPTLRGASSSPELTSPGPSSESWAQGSAASLPRVDTAGAVINNILIEPPLLLERRSAVASSASVKTHSYSERFVEDPTASFMLPNAADHTFLRPLLPSVRSTPRAALLQHQLAAAVSEKLLFPPLGDTIAEFSPNRPGLTSSWRHGTRLLPAMDRSSLWTSASLFDRGGPTTTCSIDNDIIASVLAQKEGYRF